MQILISRSFIFGILSIALTFVSLHASGINQLEDQASIGYLKSSDYLEDLDDLEYHNERAVINPTNFIRSRLNVAGKMSAMMSGIGLLQNNPQQAARVINLINTHINTLPLSVRGAAQQALQSIVNFKNQATDATTLRTHLRALSNALIAEFGREIRPSPVLEQKLQQDFKNLATALINRGAQNLTSSIDTTQDSPFHPSNTFALEDLSTDHETNIKGQLILAIGEISGTITQLAGIAFLGL